MKTLVVVHVYYPHLWPELAACIRNVGPCDLTVTYVDEAAVAEARRDFPAARFLACENRGYDVWPFVKALKAVDLGAYDLVVKLHTKRDIDLPRKTEVAYTRLNGSAWRDHLLSFVRTPSAWQKTLRRFETPNIGLVAGAPVIFRRGDAKVLRQADSFDRAIRLLADWGIRAPARGRFVGGTMFAVRAALLRPLVERPFSAEMFETSAGHDNETLAHILERLLGLLVCGQGFRVEGFDRSVFWRRVCCAVGRFLFDRRESERRRSIRLCGITVYLKRLQP